MWEIFLLLKSKKHFQNVEKCPNRLEVLILLIKVWTLFGQKHEKWTQIYVHSKKGLRARVTWFLKSKISPTSLYGDAIRSNA